MSEIRDQPTGRLSRILAPPGVMRTTWFDSPIIGERLPPAILADRILPAYAQAKEAGMKTFVYPTIVTVVLALPATAQQPAPSTYDKKEFTHSAWTRGIFSEAVTVKGIGNGKFIFLAGVGAEDEHGPRGNVRHHGDLVAQCEYAFDKIKRVLSAHGADMNHVVKVVSYLTDMKNRVPYGQCLARNFGTAPLPVHTLIGVAALAFPEMMVETDVTAITPE